MVDADHPPLEGGIPWNQIGAPARRALIGAGLLRLEDLAVLTEAQLLSLHGVGPKALRIIRGALAAHDLSFAQQNV